MKIFDKIFKEVKQLVISWWTIEKIMSLNWKDVIRRWIATKT
jgi:hypothetical protein